MFGHGLAKATLFVVAGRILADRGSPRIDDVHGLLADRPGLAWPFLAGMAMLLGFPPGSLFFTEVAILFAGWQEGLAWVSVVVAAVLVVVFAVLARHTLGMTLGPAVRELQDPIPANDGRSRRAGIVPLGLALGAAAVLAFTPPMGPLLEGAVAALGGAR